MRRRFLLSAALAVVAPTVASPALCGPAVGAPARTAVVWEAGVPSRGPDDLMFVSASGFRRGKPVSIDLVDSADASRVFALSPLVADSDGGVRSPDGYRTPADLVPGLYTLRISQVGGAVAEYSPIPIVAPELSTLDALLAPGGPISVKLSGLGGDPDIVRTLAVDNGDPVVLPPAHEDIGDASGEVYGTTSVTGTLPATLPLGQHTVTFTQAGTPAPTVTHQFTLMPPELLVQSTGSPYGVDGASALGTRGTAAAFGRRFGPAGASWSVTDAAGRSFALPALDAQSMATAVLPGLAPGNATFTARSLANGSVARTVQAVLPSSISAGHAIPGRSALLSPSGAAALSVGYDGVVVVSRGPSIVWSSGEPGSTDVTPRLAVQADGNLVVYDARGVVLWNAGTRTSDGPVTLSVLDEGRAVLTTAHGGVLWTTPTTAVTTLPAGGRMSAGQRLYDGRYSFAMQSDGNAVVYRGSLALWASRTSGNPGAVLTMQGDGNLVLRNRAGRAVWANYAPGGAGASLTLQTDGNLVERAANGRAVWVTGTAGR